MRSKKTDICYICGRSLSGEKTNRDHVPPEQFFAKELRGNGIKLVTLLTHTVCNSSYILDEEYFKHCLVPFARGSQAGDAIYKKAIDDHAKGKNRRLVRQVLESAKRVRNGVILPRGRVWLDLDRARIDRVIRKIVQGLSWIELDELVPSDCDVETFLVLPDEEPPAHFVWFMETVPTESKGHHQGVFAYRFYVEEDYRYWAMLLWDRIIVTAFYRREV